jgi:hypothetical protein
MYFHEVTSSFHSPFKHYQISRTVIPQIQNEDMVQFAIQVFRNWERIPLVIAQPFVDSENESNV